MIPISIFCLVLFTGLYFIIRGERKQKRAKIIKMKTDVDLTEDFYTEEKIS